MFGSIRRKLATLPVLFVISAGILSVACTRFSPEADPEGGSHLTLQDGWLSPVEAGDPQAILDQTVQVLRTRIDAFHLYEPKIYAEGQDRIVIELPGVATLNGEQPKSRLTAQLSAAASSLSLGESAGDFPPRGGLIRIDSKDIRYAGRTEETLTGLERGARGTVSADHAPSSPVALVSDNTFLTLLESSGHLAFMIAAQPSDFVGTGGSLVKERAKLGAWHAAHPSSQLPAFNRLPESEGGPDERIEWCIDQDDPSCPTPELERAGAVLRQENLGHPEWVFAADAFTVAYASQDELGLPAIGFKMTGPRRDDFEELTRVHQGRLLKIIVDGRAPSTAKLNGVLPGSGQIYGRFTPEYVFAIVQLLRAGLLKVAPKIGRNERFVEDRPVE
jgi:hypothetical protein